MISIQSIINDNYISGENLIRENKNDILNMYFNSNSVELPIVNHEKLVGTLLLKDFLNGNYKINNNIFTYDISTNVLDIDNIEQYTQTIIPFVDHLNIYKGFIQKSQFKHLIDERYYEKEINHFKALKDELDAILESSSDGIFITDGDGYTLNINPACAQIEDVSPEEVIGVHVTELVKQGLYSESATLKVLEEKKPVSIIQTVRNNKEVISTGTPIFENGKIVRVVTNSRDITHLNNLKKELDIANELNEKYQTELAKLKDRTTRPDDIVATNNEMRKILALAAHIAKVDTTVLLQGESGVGKGDLSKYIHQKSARRDKPFVKIDCGVIPESLLESELFGYEKGSFTGSNTEGKQGLFEVANGGTIFLDEIGEMPLKLQSKLLSVLQDRQFLKIGGKEPLQVDVRILAATNRDLSEMVNSNTFRKDLYYRLNVVPILVPSLRERKDDIAPLVHYSMRKYNIKYDFNKIIEQEAIDALSKHSWPGNVRELENMIERLLVTNTSDIITLEDIPLSIRNNRQTIESIDINNLSSFKDAVDDFEKKLLLAAMDISDNTQEMAKILKIDRSTITRKLNKHQIRIKY